MPVPCVVNTWNCEQFVRSKPAQIYDVNILQKGNSSYYFHGSYTAYDDVDLLMPQYVPFSRLAHTMHYDKYEKCVAQQQIVPSRLIAKHVTLLRKPAEFVWFRAIPAGESKYKHDWYGNVRCSLNALDALRQHPTINMFSVDCTYFGTKAASRILLTRKCEYFGSKKLNLDRLKVGDPIIYRNGKLLSAITYLRKDVHARAENSVEFVIDVDTIDTKWLWSACNVSAANHDRANTVHRKTGAYLYHQCLQHNSSKKRGCPTPWSMAQTAARIQCLAR